MHGRLIGMALAVYVLALGPGWCGTRIGAAGHFVIHRPDVWINNPGGVAFTASIRRHLTYAQWIGENPWSAVLIGPDGNEVARATFAETDATGTVEAPAGIPGVYRLAREGIGGYALPWYESSLPHMVVATGDWDMADTPYRTLILHAVAPRRWYFYVPRHVRSFELKHIVLPFQSHREDYGLIVMNPRGQRVEALFGGRPVRDPARHREAFPVTRRIEVDEGTAGRFWSIWACGGDGHNFSDLQILLRGVPPFLAPTPEQWFDPRTGRTPEPLVYDAAHVRLRDRLDASGRQVSRDHFLVTPATYLGDEDYTGMLGPAVIHWFNPENRTIDFGISTYVIPQDRRLPFVGHVTGPDGRAVLTHRGEYGHHLADLVTIPPSGSGVYRMAVEASAWFAFTEPAVPMVLEGQPDESGARFRLQTGIARHWFFHVPRGVRQFGLRVRVDDPAHRLLVEVHAPDRLVDILYPRGGRDQAVAVEVPEHLDGKHWFLRLEVGSASELRSDSVDDLRHLRVDAEIALAGVPPYLAPTHEQWFDPRNPPPLPPPPRNVTYADLVPDAAGEHAVVPFPPDLETHVYRVVEDRELKLFVTRPAEPRPALPPACIVLIHGGGWRGGQPAFFGHYARYFAMRDAVTASVEYRLVSRELHPGTDVPGETTTLFDAISDVREAVRWLRANADALGIDPERIVTVGDSSGGHLAAVGMLPAGPDEDEVTAAAAMPDAMILLNANLDLGGLYWLERGLPGIPRDGVSDAQWRALLRNGSPSAHIRPGLPPSLLIHGTDDKTTPLSMSQTFATRMCGVGNRSDLVVLDGIAHAFALANYTAKPATVVETMGVIDRWLRALGFLDDQPLLRVTLD